MRRYEVVFVLAPTVNEEEVGQFVDNFKKTAEEKGATVLDVEQWGKRRLAYPVKKFNEGIYTNLIIEEDGGVAIAELERRFKVTDAVIRFLSVRVDEDLKRQEKFRARREVRKAHREATRKESGTQREERTSDLGGFDEEGEED